jgi:transposase
MEADHTFNPNPNCPSCAAAAKRIAELERRNAELEARVAALEQKLQATLQKLESALRSGKRQAAPFSRGLPKFDPKKPGRKRGDEYGTPPAFRSMPEPSPSDQVIDVEPPAVCPACGDASAPIEESIDEQVQRDIEVRTVVRRFKVKVCRCARCGKLRRGRHPLQTSTATGCCASQVGPLARSAMAFMNKTLGLSLGKIADLFGALWGLEVTRGGVSHAIASIGNKCLGEYRRIVNAIKNSRQVTCDETGWRVGGWGAWLHVAASRQALAYLIDPHRGTEASDKIIGEHYGGTMVHDGWAPYDRYSRATHQQCDAHLLRRCDEMIDVAATPAAAIFPRKIKAILKRALRLRDQRDAGGRTPRSCRVHAGKLTRLVRRLCKPRKTNRANDRLAGFCYRHADELFTFLRHEGIDATNWRAEQALRGAVVNRKVWGGNRTWRGAETQSVLMSVINTLRLRGLDAIDWLKSTLLHQHPPALA